MVRPFESFIIHNPPAKKKPLIFISGRLKSPDYFLEKPGYPIITEGVHDLSVDMNTSFFFGEV